MRNVVRLMLLWQRFEVVCAALLPLGLIVESSLANAVVYGAGDFSDHGRAAVALLRGFFFEVLTWCAAKSAKLLYSRHQRMACVVMGVVAFFAMFVSAGNNFAWVLSGHDLGGVLSNVGRLLGNGVIFWFYELGIAVLLPVSVGAIALVDLTHL